MSEASYTAWDDNLYEWPPPAGWYQASDGKWWPEGYGPPVSADVSTEIIDERPPSGSDQSAAGTPPQGGGGQFEPGKTAVFPAGAPSTENDPARGQALSTPEERMQAESQRPVYDELPPIDDVFGGEDPYTTPDSDEPDPPPGPAAPQADRPPAVGSATDHSTNDRGHDPIPQHETSPSPAGGIGLAELTSPIPAGTNPPPNGPSESPAPRPSEPSGAPSIFGGATGHQSPPSAPPDGRNAPPASPPEQPPDRYEPPPRQPEPARTADHRVDAGHGGYRNDQPSQGYAEHEQPSPQGYAEHEQPSPQGYAESDQPSQGYAEHEQPSQGYAESDQPSQAYAEAARTGALTFDNDAGRPPEPEPSGGRGGWFLAVIGVAALAGVIGAAVWFFILRDQGGTEAADAAETTGEPRSGTIDNPYPFGTPVMVFYGEADAQVEWVVQVLQPATEQAIGDGAEAPPEGEVFAITRISILFQRGPAPGPLSDLRLNAVGAPGTVFDQTANACPSVADPIDLTASLQPGQQVEGNVCWRIPASELADLKLAIEVGEVDGTVHISLA